MARYIDVDKLLEVLKECRVYNSPKLSKLANKAISCGLSFAMQEVRNQPTADVVEVKHGHWIGQFPTVPKCSVCSAIDDMKGDYCRNCGAKMDERRDT